MVSKSIANYDQRIDANETEGQKQSIMHSPEASNVGLVDPPQFNKPKVPLLQLDKLNEANKPDFKDVEV